MEKQVVSMKELQFIQMYKTFYADQRNIQLSKSVFFKGDTVIKTKIS